MEKLERIKGHIWYAYLEGHFSYTVACDCFEATLPAKSEFLKEAT